MQTRHQGDQSLPPGRPRQSRRCRNLQRPTKTCPETQLRISSLSSYCLRLFAQNLPSPVILGVWGALPGCGGRKIKNLCSLVPIRPLVFFPDGRHCCTRAKNQSQGESQVSQDNERENEVLDEHCESGSKRVA